MPRAAIVLLALGLMSTAAAADVPKQASSRTRNVEDHLVVHLTRGTAASVLDTLTARLKRGGYAVVSRDDEKLRLTVERPATLDESNLISDTYEGSERIRLRFEVTRPKDDETGHRVTGTIQFVANLNAVNENLVDLGKRQPYLNEIRAFLRGLTADFGS